MLLHWIPSKQDWINVGLVGNSFAPNWLDLPNRSTKQLKSQNKDYLAEGNENTRSTESFPQLGTGLI